MKMGGRGKKKEEKRRDSSEVEGQSDKYCRKQMRTEEK
jgi:hypothetical protein